MADHWVTEDNRVPRPICSPCLGRLQRAMERGDRERLEAAVRAENRKRRKAVRSARKAGRR